jgi:hypothetical protein
MIDERHRITGKLFLELRDPRAGAAAVTTRAARNTVVQSGAELVASLFSGQAALPVNAMAVGADPDPTGPPYVSGMLSLTGEDGAAAFEGTAPVTVVSLAPDAFKTETLADELRVRVSVRGVFPPGVGTGLVGEAALGVLAPGAEGAPPTLGRVYNRVVFEPIRKEGPHELALYWEISFPYGP